MDYVAFNRFRGSTRFTVPAACLVSLLHVSCGDGGSNLGTDDVVRGSRPSVRADTPDRTATGSAIAPPGSGSPEAGRSPTEEDRSGTGDRVRMDTVGNTVVVTNGPTGLWSDDDAWAAREVMRLGAAHEPVEETFGSLVRAALGPDGNLYVLDPQSAVIKVFDRSGALLRQFGRPGKGPGELAAPTAMAWDAFDRLWVANAFNRRYTVFDSAGDSIKTVPRPIRGISSRHQLIFDEIGSFIDMGSSSGVPSIPLLRVDTTGAIIDSLACIPYERAPFASVPMPPDFDADATLYLSRLYFAAIPGGGAWSAKSEHGTITKTSPEGDTLRVVHFSHRDDLPFDGATRAEVERELDKLQATGAYEVVRPIISAIDVLPDGHVMVGIAEEVGEPSSLYDVYDPEGRYLGPLRFEFGIAPGVSSFRGDTMIVVTRDELDVPYIVRLHLIR